MEDKSSEKLSDKQVTKTEQSSKGKTTSKGEYKEANMKHLKSMYPDAEITEENYPTMLEQSFGEVMPKMEKYEKANTRFKSMMTNEPAVAKILGDMSQGASFVESLPRYIDVNQLEPKPGDPDYTKWEENNRKRMQTYNETMDRKTQMANNQAKSEAIIKKWFDNKGMDDEGKKSFGEFIIDLMDRAYNGEITETFLNKMYHAWKYEDDVKKAEEVGAVKGRNEKIVDEKMKSSKQKKGDGLPDVTGGKSSEKETKPDNSDGLTKGLRQVIGKKSILEGNSYV